MMVGSKLVIVWRVTEVCDLACPFCAYARDVPHPRRSADPTEVLRVGRLLQGYAASANRPVLVSLLGGEPLLWKPIFELSHTFKHEFGLQVSVTTNGTRLESEEVRKQLMADFDELIVSVDGVGSEHDRWRQQTGLAASLEKNVRRLKQLKIERGGGPRLRANTILMRDSIQEFETLCRVVADWGIEEVTFNALGGRDRPDFFPDHSLLPEQWAAFRVELPKIRQRLAPLKIFGTENYLNRLQSSITHSELRITNCHPGAQFLFIDEDGLIAPCSFTGAGYGVQLSEVQTVSDLEQLPRLFAERQQTQRLAVCDDCPSTQVWGKFDSQPPSSRGAPCG
jgi:MoaA/NifB/PqqE/SkfB family radical SAM enzyme